MSYIEEKIGDADKKRHDFLIRATTEVAALKKALAEAEDKAAMERIEHEKQNARVGEVQQELQELGKKFESLERDFKTKESELPKALLSMKDAKAEAEKAQQEIQAAKKIAAGKTFFYAKQACGGGVSFTYPNSELSRGIRISATQHIRCRGVLPCRGGELNGEAVLVPVCWGRTTNASE